MNKQHITLLIGPHRVSLNIDASKEPIYRDAAIKLNEKYNQYAAAYPSMSAELVWVYVALSMAVNLHSDARDKNLAPVVEKIRELNQLISNTLEGLETDTNTGNY